VSRVGMQGARFGGKSVFLAAQLSQLVLPTAKSQTESCKRCFVAAECPALIIPACPWQQGKI
jgi:hypothetical protein